MSTKRTQEQNQDEITDILLETYKKGGIKDTKLVLRGAAANFACECRNPENPKDEPDRKILEALAAGILTPCYLQNTKNS